MTTGTDLVDIVVEWVSGDPQRYEWDEATETVVPVEDEYRVSPPEHYGCIRRTLSGDGELLDVLLLRDSAARSPGHTVRARLVGVLRRADGDHKLLAVDPENYVVTHVSAIEAERLRAMWRWFRRRHVLLGWFGPEEARSILAESRRRWDGQHG